MSKIFKISDFPTWDGLSWAVSWPTLGVVRRQRYRLLEFAAQSGDWRVGVCAGNECVSINAELLHQTEWKPEMLDHLFGTISEVSSVAFTELKYAEKFVEVAERYIAWNLLKQGSEEHN